MHGGIDPNVPLLSQLDRVQRPVRLTEFSGIYGMTWNDPLADTTDDEYYKHLPWIKVWHGPGHETYVKTLSPRAQNYGRCDVPRHIPFLDSGFLMHRLTCPEEEDSDYNMAKNDAIEDADNYQKALEAWWSWYK